MSVYICQDRDAACVEVPAALRCKDCPERLQALIDEQQRTIQALTGGAESLPIIRRIAGLESELAAAQQQVRAFYMGTPEARLLAMTREGDELRAHLAEARAEAERYTAEFNILLASIDARRKDAP